MGELAQWDAQTPIRRSSALVSFLTGTQWVTASDQQNWFGLLPLLSGSLIVSFIALLIATPVGIGSAIYVNQIAGAREKAYLKPFIEFISAMPTVVLGFFGVMILGEFVREFSRVDALEWLPFFPIQERLNAFTAGMLLAFMAVPTIFSLTEQALDSVPKQIKDASYAVGATRLQTTWRTIIPAALPGIIAAVMFGFGRVIGETMVVLLCAGNRVKVPEFDGALEVFFEPVHTMTGMIAQEMGEVVYGSLHYHALFMIGIVLFIASLIINYSARTLARRSGSYESY
jgi:phosphate transport system permease protein